MLLIAEEDKSDAIKSDESRTVKRFYAVLIYWENN